MEGEGEILRVIVKWGEEILSGIPLDPRLGVDDFLYTLHNLTQIPVSSMKHLQSFFLAVEC